MKMKSLVLLLALAMVASIAAPALANNPFADVPADHWAYDAVTKLAAVGLVEGYPDGTYGGTRMMTRYEAAMVFARTLARLEALVEAEVAAETAGVKDEIMADLMAQIDAAKAELTELIYAELANLEIPVVEVEPVEHIIERQPIERPFQMTPEAEAAIAALVAELAAEHLADAQQVITETTIIERVVDAEGLTTADVTRIAEDLIAEALVEQATMINRALAQNAEQNTRIEALEGDVAYVENRVLGLIEGIRGDMAGLEAGINAEIDALAADMLAMSDEFSAELNLLGVRVDALERAVGVLDGRVDALEEGQASLTEEQLALRADHETLSTKVDRVQFSGSIDYELTFRDAITYPAGEGAGVHRDLNIGRDQDGDNQDDLRLSDSLMRRTMTIGTTSDVEGALNATIQAGETTTARLWLNFDGGATYGTWEPSSFGVEVLSETPMHRIFMGRLNNARRDEIRDAITPFGRRAAIQTYGALGEVKLGDIAIKLAMDPETFGAGVKWAFMDMVGLQAAAANNYQDGTSALMAGLFGDIAMFNYDLKFGMDNYDLAGAEARENNWLVDGKVGLEFAGIDLSFQYKQAAEGFGRQVSGNELTDRPFGANIDSSWEAKAGVDVFGVDLGATVYAENANADNPNLNLLAYNVTAKAGFDFFVPLAFEARVAGADNADNAATDAEMYLMGKVGIDKMDVFAGVQLSASYAYHQNWMFDNFKNPAHYTGRDLSVIAAGLGYGFDWSGATVTFGYDFEYVLPMGDTNDGGKFQLLDRADADREISVSNEMMHTVSAKYAFSSDLSFNVSGSRWIQSRETAGGEDDGSLVSNAVSAGVSFKF